MEDSAEPIVTVTIADKEYDMKPTMEAVSAIERDTKTGILALIGKVTPNNTKDFLSTVNLTSDEMLSIFIRGIMGAGGTPPDRDLIAKEIYNHRPLCIASAIKFLVASFRSDEEDTAQSNSKKKS